MDSRAMLRVGIGFYMGGYVKASYRIHVLSATEILLTVAHTN